MKPQLDRILVVEDDSMVQAVLRIALETVGGRTLEICSSGEEALERATRFAPDLILMDVVMPEMDGPTLFEGLRGLSETASTPVVFLTGLTRGMDSLRAVGAVEVLRKPFNPMTLSSVLDDLWETLHEQ